MQRVPQTEAQGRIHTSAASVAVFPEADDIEVTIDPSEIRIDVFRAGGKGGQHVNKTESAVRIVHLETGLTVSCQDEKSQLKNKDKAMKILSSRLFDLRQSEKQAKESASRRTMVGSGDRSEKIRTYNFPQNRLSDHRINLTLYKLDAIINGDLQQVIDALAAADLNERIKLAGYVVVTVSSSVRMRRTMTSTVQAVLRPFVTRLSRRRRKALSCGIGAYPPARVGVRQEHAVPSGGGPVLDERESARVDSIAGAGVQASPLPYVLGVAHFCSLELAVSPDVLIPRPETEILVEAVLANEQAHRARFVDMGIGSGAISAALLNQRPFWTGIGIDSSFAALRIARRNCPRTALAS